MTEQRKHIIKVIFAVLWILALPSLFFQYIGDNPMAVKENATRTIAVVNEDLGVEDGNESLNFGKEIPSLLNEGSDYNWTVLGRSAAENGLKSLKYDAIIYIPSNFSESILTYDDEHPKRATLKYAVQDQLNAVNKEKVVRELEDASNEVNSHMSSLYWSYISQEVEHVREQFDKILEKEIAFQNAMFSFYNPGSQKLSGELSQQKELLEQLQANIKLAEEGSLKRKGDVEQIEQNLKHFVEYVEEYKQYHQKQKEILTQIQDESTKMIQAGMSAIREGQSQTDQTFGEQTVPIQNGIVALKKMLQDNADMMNQVSVVRLSRIDQQKEEMEVLHENLVNQYGQLASNQFESLQNNVFSMREELVKKTGEQPNNGENENSNNEKNEHPSHKEETTQLKDTKNKEEFPTPTNTVDQQKELQAIATETTLLKESLQAIPEDEQPQEVNDAIANLDSLTKRIEQVVVELQNKDTEDEQWQKKYQELLLAYEEQIEENNRLKDEYGKIIDGLNGEIDKLHVQIDELNAQMEDVINSNEDLIKGKIKQIEDELLANYSNLLTDTLKELFQSEMKSKDTAKMLDYYSELSRFASTVNLIAAQNDKYEGILEEASQNTASILDMKENEKQAWDNLEADMLGTEEGLNDFEASFAAFIQEYRDFVDEEQANVMKELDAIQASSAKITEQLQKPDDITADGTYSDQSPDGTILISLQKSMGQELHSMNELMESLGERQGNIVDYTGDLEQKVSEVQEKADTLNEKWSQNVTSTKLVRNDVYTLLGNAFVDGQNNGYVYDYLSNPLEISGEIPSVKEKTVPPVVILVIVLISSLLIGYLSQYYSQAPLLVKGALFGLLNLIVGLMISLFGLNIYSLEDDRAIQWTIFTILLLVATSLLVRLSFRLGSLFGWFVSVGLILFYVTPLLNLTIPNFNYEDPVSKVYMSIQYEASSLFGQAVILLIGITVVLTVIPLVIRLFNSDKNIESENAHEA